MPRCYETASIEERRRLAVAPPRSRYRYSRRRWRWLFAVVDAVGYAFMRVARGIARGTRRGPAPSRPPGAILLVQLDHFGDALITRGMLPALREALPGARIDVLAGPWNREVFEASPEIDRVHVSQVNRFARHRRGFWWLATIAWGLYLRRFRYDWAIDVRGEFPLALLLWLCGARRRIGWNCGGGGFLLTDSPPFVAGRREIEARWALLSAMGIDRAPQGPSPSFEVGAYSRGIVEHWLRAAPRGGGPRMALHVGAGTQAKQWPDEHWRELIGRLIVQRDARIVLVGGAEDVPLAERITEGRDWPGLVNLVGQTRVDELAAVIESADLLIGADSGPAHLAACVGTPAIVLFSGTNDPAQWRPAGQRITVLRADVMCSPCHRTSCYWDDHPCLRQLPPAAVMQAVERHLEHRGAAISRGEVSPPRSSERERTEVAT